MFVIAARLQTPTESKASEVGLVAAGCGAEDFAPQTSTATKTSTMLAMQLRFTRCGWFGPAMLRVISVCEQWNIETVNALKVNV